MCHSICFGVFKRLEYDNCSPFTSKIVVKEGSEKRKENGMEGV